MLAKHALYQLSYGPNAAPSALRRASPVAGIACMPNPAKLAGRNRMVGPGRLELPTSRLSGVRSNQLSYGPGARAKRPALTEDAGG
jgi:hypothetical protein